MQVQLTIGGYERFELSLKDATAIMDALSRATKVETGYLPRVDSKDIASKSVRYATDSAICQIDSIRASEYERVTEAEYRQMRDSRDALNEAAKAETDAD